MADNNTARAQTLIDLLLTQQGEAQQRQDDVAARSAAVDTAIADQPVRGDRQEVEPLSRLQSVLQGLLSGASVFAGGLNQNVQPQNFGQNILDIRQEQIDRLNAAEDLKFEDESRSALIQLQDLISQRGTAQQQANIEQERITRSSEREQERGERVQEREFRASEARASDERQRALRVDLQRMENDLRKQLSGVKDTTKQAAADAPFLAGIFSGVIETRKAIEAGTETATSDELLQEFKDDLDRMPQLSASGKLAALEFFKAQLGSLLEEKKTTDIDVDLLKRDREERALEERLRRQELRPQKLKERKEAPFGAAFGAGIT